MKKIIVSVLFLLTTSVYSQQILGIGDFLIGMSNDDFLSLPVIKAKSISETDKHYESPKAHQIFRQTVDTKYPPQMIGTYKMEAPLAARIFSSDVVRYKLVLPLGVPDAQGRDAYDIEVTFYKEKLSRINVWKTTGEFPKILEQKYGKPEVKDNSKMETCQNGYGAKTEHFSGSISSIWRSKENIEARYTFGNYSCGKYPYFSYQVVNTSESETLYKIQQDGEKKYKDDQIKEKSSGSKL
jgi:hypothetical protein